MLWKWGLSIAIKERKTLHWCLGQQNPYITHAFCPFSQSSMAPFLSELTGQISKIEAIRLKSET